MPGKDSETELLLLEIAKALPDSDASTVALLAELLGEDFQVGEFTLAKLVDAG